MRRAARILSVAQLPRILLKEESGKLRSVELEAISIEPDNKAAYLFLRQFLNVPAELLIGKNSEKGRLIVGGRDLSALLLQSDLAKLVLSEQVKSFTGEELQTLKQAFENRKAAPKSTDRELPLDIPITASLDILKNQLVLIDQGAYRQVSLKSIELLLEGGELERLAEFAFDSLLNISVVVNDIFYDTLRNVEVTEVSLPFEVEKEMLRRGWATLRADAQYMLPQQQYSELYQASALARYEFRGIWHSYFDNLDKIYDPPFQARIVKVIEGHRYVIKHNKEVLTIELSRVACPTHKENGAYECRQTARRELAGKKVSVFLQKTKVPTSEHKALIIRQDDDALVDKMLIERGMATVRTSTNFRSDPHREVFVEIDKRNREDKIGIYTNEFNVFRFEDLTRLENKIEKASAKEFAARVLTNQTISIGAVVEGFKDAARVIVRIPFYRAIIVVKLDGVKTLTTNSKEPAVNAFKQSSLSFCEDHYMQKDVDLLLSHFSEEGGFNGTILLNKKNIVEDLLSEGLVRITDKSLAKFAEVEQKAADEKKGIWVPELAEHMSERRSERLFEKLNVSISYVDKGAIIYYQRKEDLNTIDDIAAELEGELAPLTVGRKYANLYYAAPFQGAYYRAKVEEVFVHKNSSKDVAVYFMDYGNCAILKTSELRELPSSAVMQNKDLAHRITLAFLEPLTSSNEMSENALQAINSQLMGHSFLLERRIFESETPRRTYEIAMLYEQGEKNPHPYISKNYTLVAEGLLKIQPTQLQFIAQAEHQTHLLQLEQEARKKGLFIWYDNNEQQFDRDECSKMKGFNTFMSSNY